MEKLIFSILVATLCCVGFYKTFKGLLKDSSFYYNLSINFKNLFSFIIYLLSSTVFIIVLLLILELYK